MTHLDSIKPFACDTVSDKYQIIDSTEIVRRLEDRGFELFKIMHPQGKTAHTVWMRYGNGQTWGGEEVCPMVIFKNGYDGHTAFSAQVGIFRFVCRNGLVVSPPGTKAESFNTIHLGDAAAIAEDIVMKMAEHLPELVTVHEKMSSTVLTEKEAIDLALKAAKIRWTQTFTEEDAKVLLEAARPEDEGMTAWLVFNRVQENVLKGGVRFENMKRAARPLLDARKHFEANQQLFEIFAQASGIEVLEPELN
jgi:hypothetical protein